MEPVEPTTTTAGPLSQMEVLLLGELLQAEEIAARKAQAYADAARDDEVRQLLGAYADAHRQKIQGLMCKLRTYGLGGGH